MVADEVQHAGELVNGHPYKRAVEHLQICSYQQTLCPMGCGLRLYQSEMAGHRKICEKVVATCPLC